jgi:hypothetical protein
VLLYILLTAVDVSEYPPVIFLFDDDTKITITSWNKFNCDGKAYFTLSEDDLELVKLYYGYNDEKARQALSILSDDQLTLIKEKQEKGGIK